MTKPEADWEVHKVLDGDEHPGEIHVTPVGDVVDHYLTGECACIPDSEVFPGYGPDVWIYTHHSIDGREVRK